MASFMPSRSSGARVTGLSSTPASSVHHDLSAVRQAHTPSSAPGRPAVRQFPSPAWASGPFPGGGDDIWSSLEQCGGLLQRLAAEVHEFAEAKTKNTARGSSTHGLVLDSNGVVTDVQVGSPAFLAKGVSRGDMIRRINGRSATPERWAAACSPQLPAGSLVALELAKRGDGQLRAVTLTSIATGEVEDNRRLLELVVTAKEQCALAHHPQQSQAPIYSTLDQMAILLSKIVARAAGKDAAALLSREKHAAATQPLIKALSEALSAATRVHHSRNRTIQAERAATQDLFETREQRLQKALADAEQRATQLGEELRSAVCARKDAESAAHSALFQAEAVADKAVRLAEWAVHQADAGRAQIEAESAARKAAEAESARLASDLTRCAARIKALTARVADQQSASVKDQTVEGLFNTETDQEIGAESETQTSSNEADSQVNCEKLEGNQDVLKLESHEVARLRADHATLDEARRELEANLAHERKESHRRLGNARRSVATLHGENSVLRAELSRLKTLATTISVSSWEKNNALAGSEFQSKDSDLGTSLIQSDTAQDACLVRQPPLVEEEMRRDARPSVSLASTSGAVSRSAAGVSAWIERNSRISPDEVAERFHSTGQNESGKNSGPEVRGASDPAGLMTSGQASPISSSKFDSSKRTRRLGLLDEGGCEDSNHRAAGVVTMASLHSTLDDQVRLLQEKLEGMQGYVAGGVLQAVATTRMEEDVAEVVITEGDLGTASLAPDQVSKVDADIDCMASELAVLGAQVRALKLEQETSEQRVSAAQRQVSALENEQSFLGSELTSNREELRKLDVQVAERAESLRGLHEEAGRVTEMLSSLKAEVEAGKEVRDAALKEAALLGETAERSRRAREEDDNHRAELERETTALREEVKALMEERWRLSSDVETLSEEWRIAQAGLSSMESHRAEAYELEARIEELAKQLKTQRETQGSLVEELGVLEEKRARVMKTIQEMEISRRDLADKYALQTADHVKVQRAVKQLSEERTSGDESLQTQREELKKMQEEIDKTTGQLQDKMKALTDLEARIAVAQAECEAQEREGHRQKTIIRSAQEEYVWLQTESARLRRIVDSPESSEECHSIADMCGAATQTEKSSGHSEELSGTRVGDRDDCEGDSSSFAEQADSGEASSKEASDLQWEVARLQEEVASLNRELALRNRRAMEAVRKELVSRVGTLQLPHASSPVSPSHSISGSEGFKGQEIAQLEEALGEARSEMLRALDEAERARHDTEQAHNQIEALDEVLERVKQAAEVGRTSLVDRAEAAKIQAQDCETAAAALRQENESLQRKMKEMQSASEQELERAQISATQAQFEEAAVQKQLDSDHESEVQLLRDAVDLTEAKARGLEEVMRALDRQAREMIAERDKLWEAVRALETENELSQAGLANNEQRGPEEGVRDGQPCEEDAVHGAERDGLSRENAQHMSQLRTDIRSSDSRLATAEVFSATENQGIPLGFVKGAREAVVEHHATLSSMAWTQQKEVKDHSGSDDSDVGSVKLDDDVEGEPQERWVSASEAVDDDYFLALLYEEQQQARLRLPGAYI